MQYNVNNTTKTLQVCKQHQIASGNILVNKPITCLALVTMKACVHITNNTTLSVQVCKKKPQIASGSIIFNLKYRPYNWPILAIRARIVNSSNTTSV